MEVKIVIQSYIVGLLIEMGIIAVLTSCGMMIVGVQYAILLGVITAVLNLIPYIGILSATLMAIVAASINSTDLSVVLGSVAVNATVHFIDNNFLIPKIVASKVRINALASIIGVITGGLLAGIMGMFLAIPIIAIIKVIFDRISDLEPWGFLMGDDLPKTFEWGIIKLPAFDAGNEDVKEEKKDEDLP